MARLLIALTPLLVGLAVADDKKPADPFPVTGLPRVKPREPAESLKSFDLRPGFRVELVAAEPLSAQPVAIDFDENGRLYVVEFPEYNQYDEPEAPAVTGLHPAARRHATATASTTRARVFADDLPMRRPRSPAGTAASSSASPPDLLYLKDTDGDGKADVTPGGLHRLRPRQGGRGDAQLVPLGAGQPLPHRHRARGRQPCGRPISPTRSRSRCAGRTSCFDPRSGTLRADERRRAARHDARRLGPARSSAATATRSHLVMYDSRYLARNPFLLAPPPAVNMNAARAVHEAAPHQPGRAVAEAAHAAPQDQGLVPGSDEGGQPFGFFTGATGVTVYRGDAFPAEFRGNIFVGECREQPVYRARLEPKGIGCAAERAEKDREFLASSDIWFRPVQFANAPDGCLYVIDMYRELIEGAAFLPPQSLKHLDVASGIDRGRIWRIVPEGFHAEAAATRQGGHRRNSSRCSNTRTAGTATPPPGCSTSDRTRRRFQP